MKFHVSSNLSHRFDTIDKEKREAKKKKRNAKNGIKSLPSSNGNKTTKNNTENTQLYFPFLLFLYYWDRDSAMRRLRKGW